jgi:hypothetical protein
MFFPHMNTGPWWMKIIFFVWSLAWLGGAWGFFAGADSEAGAAIERARPLTGVVDAGPIRVEATVDTVRSVVGPVTGRQCAAVLAGVGAYSSKTETDRQGKSRVVHEYASVRKRREPEGVTLRAGSGVIEVATAHWRPTSGQQQTKYQQEPPDGWQLTPDEISAAESRLGGRFAGWYVDEDCLPAGQQVLLLGVVELRDGVRRVLPPDGSEFVDLFPGTQADAVADARSSATGLRIAGYGFIGVSTLPWLALVAVVARARRKAAGQP